jgi:hypothetical protein
MPSAAWLWENTLRVSSHTCKHRQLLTHVRPALLIIVTGCHCRSTACHLPGRPVLLLNVLIC